VPAPSNSPKKSFIMKEQCNLRIPQAVREAEREWEWAGFRADASAVIVR